MTRDLVGTVNDNLRTAFVRLADNVSSGEVRQFGSITVASAGLPLPVYNRAFIFDPPPRDEVAKVVEWLTKLDVPFWITAREAVADTVGDIAANLERRQHASEIRPGIPFMRYRANFKR